MAAKEIYDYLTQKTADVDVTLSIVPQKLLNERYSISQAIHRYDSGKISAVTLSDSPSIDVTFQYSSLSESESGTIVDLYLTSANGSEKTIYWEHIDGHTYVIRFMGELSRSFTPDLFATRRSEINQIEVRIEGRK